METDGAQPRGPPRWGTAGENLRKPQCSERRYVIEIETKARGGPTQGGSVMRGIQNPALHKAAVVLLTALGLALACASERGMDPEPERYRLYVSTTSWNSRVYVVDTETDSLIDSTMATDGSTAWGDVTPDGRYVLRHSYPLCTEVLDAATLTKVKDLPGCALFPAFAIDDGLILGTHSTGQIDIISYPELSLADTDTIVLEGNPRTRRPLVDPSRDLVYFALFYGEGQVDRVELLAWDYVRRQIQDQWDLPVNRFTIAPGTSRLYAIVGNAVLSYDLSSRTVLWQQPILTEFGCVQLTPDGRELWRSDRGNVFFPRISGYVYIHDPQSGVVTDSISLFGYLSETAPLPGGEIVFTPDGRKAYVATSHISYSAGPVLVIDVATREVLKLLFDDFRHYPDHLSIGPAP